MVILNDEPHDIFLKICLLGIWHTISIQFLVLSFQNHCISVYKKYLAQVLCIIGQLRINLFKIRKVCMEKSKYSMPVHLYCLIFFYYGMNNLPSSRKNAVAVHIHYTHTNNMCQGRIKVLLITFNTPSSPILKKSVPLTKKNIFMLTDKHIFL